MTSQSLFNFTFSEQPKPRTQSHMVTSKTGSNDVVDALQFVRNGSSMMMIENDEYRKWDTYRLTQDKTSVINSANQVVVPLAAVESVAGASEINVSNALEILEISHVKPDGLEPVLFSVTLLGGHTISFVADSPRSCYIWMRAMQALTEATSELSMIPLMVSNRLRSGTLVHGQHMMMDDEEETIEAVAVAVNLHCNTEECISKRHHVHIPLVLAHEWQYFEGEIAAIDRFINVFCILDSTQHLVLLGDILRLKNRLNDIESLLHKKNKSGEAFYGWGNWPEIYEKWWLLHADIAVTNLRIAELREELGLKN